MMGEQKEELFVRERTERKKPKTMRHPTPHIYKSLTIFSSK